MCPVGAAVLLRVGRQAAPVWGPPALQAALLPGGQHHRDPGGARAELGARQLSHLPAEVPAAKGELMGWLTMGL